MSLIVDEHRELLSDPARIGAYACAIAEVVRPGSTVLDLASGTGVLGLMACRAGAARVYSIEVSGMTEIVRSVAAANGFADRLTVLYGLSSHLTLPERVDVIVCDQVGRFGIEAGLITYGSDARDRFLRPGGALVPGELTLCVAPVESPEFFERVRFWETRPAGFDFSPAREWAANTGYPARLEAADLLGSPHDALTFDLHMVTRAPTRFSREIEITRRGVLHGIGGWFSARLSHGVTMTNAPGAEGRIARRNVFFPVSRPISVEAGDTVIVSMHMIPSDTIAWTVEARRGGASLGYSRHSTVNGMLLPREDLHRTDPRYAPTLTDRGVARQSVLELCDGQRPLAEIERAVYERHRTLFGSPSEAAAFVAEVVTRYSR